LTWFYLLAGVAACGLGWWAFLRRESWPMASDQKYWLDDEPSTIERLRKIAQAQEKDDDELLSRRKPAR